MTRSKIEIATRLAELRQDGSTPDELAKTLTVMKMHHEIEKILEARETAEPAPETGSGTKVSPPPEPEFKSVVQSIFEFFSSDRE
jgi:hypothetical protein